MPRPTSVARLVVTLTVLSCGLACSHALAAHRPPTRTTSSPKGFRTATGTVTCGLKGSALVCIVPNPSKAGSCKGSYVVKGRVRRRGKAVLDVGCFGGLPYDVSGFKTVRSGRRITRRGVTCTAGRRSMRCVNRSKHGFTLKRAGASSF